METRFLCSEVSSKSIIMYYINHDSFHRDSSKFDYLFIQITEIKTELTVGFIIVTVGLLLFAFIMKADMKAMEARVEAKRIEDKAEMKADKAELKAEMKADKAEMKFQYNVTTLIAIVAAIGTFIMPYLSKS